MKTKLIAAAIVAVGLGAGAFALPEITNPKLVKIALQQSLDRFPPQASTPSARPLIDLCYSTAAKLLTAAGFDVTAPNIVALTVALVVLGGVSILLYSLPAIIAEERKHQHGVPIFLLNLLLGWTFLG
jgi:Superinfection immunity protein